MPSLHLVCGLPGSGKSTLAQELELAGVGVRFEPDEWLLALGAHLYDEMLRDRVERLQWTVARRLLLSGTSVILENGIWTRKERARYRAEAAAAGAATVLHFLVVKSGELRRRVAERNAGRPADAVVDPDDLSNWAAMFEPPNEEERVAACAPRLGEQCRCSRSTWAPDLR